MKRHCKQCGKQTETVHNDFMVGFCAVCYTMRGSRSDYIGNKRTFECSECGTLSDETYVNQRTCLNCDEKS